MTRVVLTMTAALLSCSPPPPPSPLVGTWKTEDAVELRDWGFDGVTGSWLRVFDDGGFEFSTNREVSSQSLSIGKHLEVGGRLNQGSPLEFVIESGVECDSTWHFSSPGRSVTCARHPESVLLVREWTLDGSSGQLTLKFDEPLSTLGPFKRTAESGPRPTVSLDQVEGFWSSGAPLADDFTLSTGMSLDAGFPGSLSASIRVGTDGSLRYRELEQTSGRAQLSELRGTITIDGGLVRTSALLGEVHTLSDSAGGGVPTITRTSSSVQSMERFVSTSSGALFVSGLPVSSFRR